MTHLDLSPRQLECLKLIARGELTKSIADILHISIKTVQLHRYNLMHRLGLHSIAEVVHYALHHNLIPNLYESKNSTLTLIGKAGCSRSEAVSLARRCFSNSNPPDPKGHPSS